MKNLMFASILKALPLVINMAARKHESVRQHLAGKKLVVQIGLKDGSIARHFVIAEGKVRGHKGRASKPDAAMTFKDVDLAMDFLKPNPDSLVVIDAMKNFKVTAQGEDSILTWFGSLMNLINTSNWEAGVKMEDGSMRYANLTNGGPLFVYVKDGKIIRTTPIDFGENDPTPWSIEARGKSFTPHAGHTVSAHALAMKSIVYSEKRVLYPMKRVDFDPDGERNTQNRGISGYERISWDEALDIVSKEIQRQKREHGPGSILMTNPAHHQWGNVNYWLSSLQRFMNIIGASRVGFTAISWEGWYQGAMHHFGNNFRLGMPGFTGTFEDCIKEAEQIVFWSSDPESTSGVYAGLEGTQRRQYLQELGIEFVHIDPHLNMTAQMYGGKWIPVKPGTDSAMAQAIMYQWIIDGTYDKDYVAKRTDGFEEWKDYLLGVSDGVPKTPEWQEPETGVPAKDVRTLARQWAKKKTYLSAGSLGAGLGGACRADTGSMWTRCMVQMMAMQGWGKPGINFGNGAFGARMDLSFYFPGYSEGGISGDLVNNASAVNNYQRMPHILTMNSCQQIVPRQRVAEAILWEEGDAQLHGGPMDPSSPQAQMQFYEYPKQGYSPIRMLYRYGTSNMGVILQSGRMIEAMRSPKLEFTVSQCMHLEGDAQFSDIILPACSSFERWDIAESANAGGVLPLGHYQLNHRMFVLQQKAIEPLGESKADYDIFTAILDRIGGAGMYTEGGNSALNWCKRVFDGSDLPKKITWKEFFKKGYYVLPPIPVEKDYPTEFRWFAEGRAKDTPEMVTMPSQHTDKIGSGLGTPSSKFEFIPKSLRMIEKKDPRRPAVNKYIPSWEGLQTKGVVDRFPLQLLTAHPTFSFHTQGDGKKAAINTIKDHRVTIDGYAYWIVRMNPEDAAVRGLKQHDLVKVFNDRGVVICAVDSSPIVMKGTIKSYGSAAEVDLINTPEGVVERGGCMNFLTSSRQISETSDGIAPNTCLVEIKKWDGIVSKEAA